jgi:tetrapyrrole methylase family protein / MazG family protein
MPSTSEYFSELRQTIKTLLGEKGCPWDKRQTNLSLQKHLISELAELNTAIDRRDHENICEELGDLLYLIILISEINDRQGIFSLDQVLQTVTAKLIRRHPHVFEEFTVKSDEELRAQWLSIKAREKSEKLI